MRLALALIATVLVPPTATFARHHPAYAHHHRVYRSGGYDSGYYTAVSGHQVHRPMRAGSRPAGATAHCRDDTWSFSESHRGTCSHHGGVASWL